MFGRKPLLLVGIATEVLRALLFAVVSDPMIMMLVQLLDGITGAIVTILTVLIITDFTTGSGRFNLAQGVVGTMTGIAAAASTTIIGFLVDRFGDLSGFLTMAGTSGLGLALLWVFLPESKPAKYLD
jgi:MFS family permease